MPSTIVHARLHRALRLLPKVGVSVLAFLVLGNAAIYAASTWARKTTETRPVVAVAGIDNLEAVDSHLWRGAAPTKAGYEALAARGVSTVVDLRADDGAESDGVLVSELGMKLVRIPIPDGQTPTAEEVQRFLQAAQESPGLVFVHCGAGVGRTGTMVGAYEVSRSDKSGTSALRRNLAVGPPSLEQMAYVANLEDGRYRRPSPMLTAMSRVLDAPRRLAHRLGL